MEKFTREIPNLNIIKTSKLHTIAEITTKSHKIPQDPTRSHKIPQDWENLVGNPNKSTGSHKIPQDFQDLVGKKHLILQRHRPQKFPGNLVGSCGILWDPVGSCGILWDPVDLLGFPTRFSWFWWKKSTTYKIPALHTKYWYIQRRMKNKVLLGGPWPVPGIDW